MKKLTAALTFTLLASIASTALAADAKEYSLTIKDHVFTPDTVEVPAKTAFTLRVKNADATAEEFESHKLKVEKVIAPGAEVVVHVRPLEAGTYKFEGEYNHKTARGQVIAK